MGKRIGNKKKITTKNVSGQMGGYYNPYTSAGFSAAHMAAAAAAAAAQQTGQVTLILVKQSKNKSYIVYKNTFERSLMFLPV